MFLGYIDPGSGFTIFGFGGWLIAFLLGFFGLFLASFKKIFRFIRKQAKKIIIIVSILIVVILALTGVAMMDKKEFDFHKKCIILTFDGLSPDIVESMMKEENLPSFLKLKEEGAYRYLSTTNPSQSPVAWVGFATGQNPGKNGIYDFIIRDPKTYNLSLSLSKVIKGKPRKVIKSKRFWQYTSEARIPAIIINCPITFPPDKIYGKMLSGMGVPDILGTEGTFTFYTTEMLDTTRYIGGEVFQIKKYPTMIIHLIGPKTAHFALKTENIKVPVKVVLQEGQNKITIEYQDHKFELKEGRWSDWKEVVFKLGLFKEMRGILKFYLVETTPHFKLYISPINFDPRNPFFTISYPRQYSKELADSIGLYYTQGMPMDTWAVNEKRITEEPFLEQVNVVFGERKTILDFELARFKKGVFFFYFESPDIIQHMFWRYTDPQHPLYEENAPREYKTMIQTWYKKMDEVLGNVMKKISKEDMLIVLSDHGFGTFRRAVHINSWLRKNGYLELKDPYAESGADLLKDIDWSKTKAYAIGFGAVYINQRGREGQGIVSLGQETEILKTEIAEKLKEWTDEKYKKSVINQVYNNKDIFWGNYTKQAPDLYIGFNVGYRASWQTALGAVPKDLIEDNLKKWSGDHLFDPGLIPGILFTNKQIMKETPSIYDIAPTILKGLGLDEKRLRKCNFDGEPLF